MLVCVVITLVMLGLFLDQSFAKATIELMCPLRAALQTADVARRLMRGGELHQEEGASS